MQNCFINSHKPVSNNDISMFQWSSSPVEGVGRYAIPLINILITAYTFTTGMHVDQVIQHSVYARCSYMCLVPQIVTFFQQLRCACPGRSLMYNMSASVINKVVYSYWLRMQVPNQIYFLISSVSLLQEKLIQERIDSKKALNLGGDGSYDSPGFSARYCNYIVMDLDTTHILSFFTAIKFHVSYNNLV